MAKEKVIQRKYKNKYNGLLVFGIWLFILFLISNIIYKRCVVYCPVNIQRNLDGLRTIIFFTGMVIIVSWCFLKYKRENYTLIGLEGDVIK